MSAGLAINMMTRGRPKRLLDTLRKTVPNLARRDTLLMVSIDEDDLTTNTSIMIGELHSIDDRILVSVKPREDSRGEKYDRILEDIIPRAEVYMIFVDSAPALTPGFDQTILNAAALYPDGIGCVYTLPMVAWFPSYIAITAKLVRFLGGICNREYPFWFIDHELDDIARMLGRYACVDVTIDCSFNDNPEKKTIRMHDVGFWANYYNAMTWERVDRVVKIIESDEFQAESWFKKMLISQYPVTVSRSYNINMGVANKATELQANRGDPNPPDEGYKRMKAAAELKLKRMGLKFVEEVA